MKVARNHHCRVLGAPWDGVYSTHIESAHHFARHWHDTYGIGFVEHGAHRSASGRGVVDAYAGDVITTNPGEVHDGRPLGGPSRRWRLLSIEPAVMASMSERGADLEITRPVFDDLRLRRALERLFARLEAGGDRLASEEALVETCALLLRHTTSAPPREAHGEMQRVRERLADDLAAVPTLGELAAMAGLGKYQLLRRFEKVYGVPPHAWLRQRRAERARTLIRDGASLSSAAAACGFADQSHMTRAFVRHFGFTPGAWRKAAARRPQ
jgi:AraC-like DNA-binding protein